MRILLYYLIVLNLLYAGWEYLRPAQSNIEVPALSKKLATLELLEGSYIESSIGLHDDAEKEMPEEADFKIEVVEQKKLPLACFTLGPFKDEGIMQQIRESLSETIKDVSVRTLEESEKHRYWVYIPPLASRSQAKNVARKLKQSKLKDYYVVLGGDTKNSISLGHFKEPAYANRRARKVSKLGFETEIEVIYKKYNVHWIDYRAVKGDEELETLISSHVSEGVSRINRSCDESL